MGTCPTTLAADGELRSVYRIRVRPRIAGPMCGVESAKSEVVPKMYLTMLPKPNNIKQMHQPNIEKETAREPTVKNNTLSTYVTRESILMLLSDDEVAAVATAETATRLPEGDEYLDMEQLDQGVQRAHHKKMPMGRMLPKKAVNVDTWKKLLAKLPAHPVVKAHGGKP